MWPEICHIQGLHQLFGALSLRVTPFLSSLFCFHLQVVFFIVVLHMFPFYLTIWIKSVSGRDVVYALLYTLLPLCALLPRPYDGHNDRRAFKGLP